MTCNFFLLANALLAASLVGMVAIFAKNMPPLSKAGVNFSFRWTLPKKAQHLLQATKERKSLLKKDYWDKLLK